MKKYLFLFIFASLLGNRSLLLADKKNEMSSYNNPQYGFSFLYPKSWELQARPDPLEICEYKINLRPSAWQSVLPSKEYRRNSDFPVQIYLCPRDFETESKSQGYRETDDGWINTLKGMEMGTEEIKGEGWVGIMGEVPFKSVTKTGQEGPVLFLDQAVLSISSNKSALILMEKTCSPWNAWGIDDLLKTLKILPHKK